MTPYEILRTQLAHAITEVRDEDPQRIVDVVLRTLEQQRVIAYGVSSDIRLLSNIGRVFVAVLENPDMTQRALAAYLSMSEPALCTALQNLEQAGLLVTTKSGRVKTAKIASLDVLRHPDITRFFDVIARLVRENLDSPADPNYDGTNG